MKSAVAEERDITNADFFTYDDLLANMARRIQPEKESEKRIFSAFTQVQFGDTTGTGTASTVSFEKDFTKNFLQMGERNAMVSHKIQPLTLWSAFRTIKSSVGCSVTKAALTEAEYLALPPSYGLDAKQRTVVYGLFLRYGEWLSSGGSRWDEADRVLYILRHGGSVFSDDKYISWHERAFSYYEDGIVDSENMPNFPYFHTVAVDEAQDFSEMDLALLIRMSGGVRSLFIGADPAQSVELGVRMRSGTVNRVFDSFLKQEKGRFQVRTTCASYGIFGRLKLLPTKDTTPLLFCTIVGQECVAKHHAEDKPLNACNEPERFEGDSQSTDEVI